MYQALIIVDDFYDHPMEVRKLALSADFPPLEGPLTFPGRNSRQTFLPPGLDRVMSGFVGEPVVGAASERIAHGKFRITLEGEPSRYLAHVDPTILSWVGLVYLSLPEHCRGGTSFFRHRGLQSDRVPKPEQLHAYGVDSVAQLLQQDGRDPEKWEHLMTIPMRFNRLVIYRPWLWHSADQSFGQSLEDGRLVHLVFCRSAGSG